MGEEKPYPPSERKKRRAWESGDLIKSREITGICICLTAVLCVPLMAGLILIFVTAFFQHTFGAPKDFQSNNMLVSAGAFAVQSAKLTLGVLLGLAFSAVLGEYLQIGTNGLKTENLLRWQRVNPAENAMRLLRWQSWMDSFRGVGLLLVGLGILVPLLRDLFTLEIAKELIASDGVSRFLKRELLRICSLLLLFGAGAAILDYFLLRRSWRKRNSMSREELKEEMKESEGNPEVRSMRRHLHGELLAQSEVQSVRRSRVVLVQRSSDEPRTPQP